MEIILPGIANTLGRLRREKKMKQREMAELLDIAGVLRVGSKQCSVILRHLVEAGELVQVRQKYYLNTQAEAR